MQLVPDIQERLSSLPETVVDYDRSLLNAEEQKVAAKLIEAAVGAENKLGGVSIKAEKCKHNATTPVTYIVTSEDNLKTFHTADSQPYPEMATIAQKEQFDLVFCTVGIAPGATPQTGAEIAWLTKPKIAVPYHTNTVLSQKQFQDIIRREQPKTTCLIPEQNKIYQVTKPEVKT